MERDRRRFRDILDCADELAGYLRGVTLDDFQDNPMLRRACERLLMIIGEAAKNLSDGSRSQIDQPWRDIIRFRDKGVHHYNALSDEAIYDIATISVPALAQAIHQHMGS